MTQIYDGWIVLPFRYYPGWSAYLNGKELKMEKYLGFLPAIKPSELGKLELKYHPKKINLGLMISTFSIFILELIRINETRLQKLIL